MLIHPWDEATRAEWQEVHRAVDFAQLDHFEPPDSRRVPPSTAVEQRHDIAAHLAARDAPGDVAAREHLLRRLAD